MNNLNFDWALIPSFLAALKHGSLLGAARATGTSQPTLGRHIAELEAQLQQVLFERTGRGLVPTERALCLAEAARDMQAGADRLARLADGAGQEAQGRVRLSASQPIACFVLPPILARMRQAMPGLVVELVVSNAVSNLLRREADIALRMVQPEQSSLVARRIGEVGLQACASWAYVQRHGRPERPSDLLHHALIAGDRQRDIEAGFEAMGWSADQLVYGLRTDDLVAQWAAVRAGLGVGFAGRHQIAADPEVCPLLPELAAPVLPLWLTVHRELRTSTRLRLVSDFLAQAVPEALAVGQSPLPVPDGPAAALS